MYRCTYFFSIFEKSVREQLWQDVESISVRKYAGSIRAVTPEAVPFLWDPKTRQVTAAALEHGKGRGIATSRQVLLAYLGARRDRNPGIYNAWNKWLTRGKTPNIAWYNCDSLLFFNANGPFGLIITPRCGHLDAMATYEKFRDGIIPNLLLVHAGWISERFNDDTPFNVLAALLGVRFQRKVANWVETTLPTRLFTSKSHSYTHLPLVTMLSVALRSERDFAKITDLPTFSHMTPELQNVTREPYVQNLVKKVCIKYAVQMEELAPTIDRPFYESEPTQNRQLIINYNELLFAQDGKQSDGVKMPGISQFPGDIIPSKQREPSRQHRMKRVTVEHRFVREEHATGLYARPGETFAYRIIDSDAPADGDVAKWSIRIGCHTDKLLKKDYWTRFPIASHTVQLQEGRGTIYSPVGGLIYILNKRRLGRLTIDLFGLEEAAFFNVRDPRNLARWSAGRYRETRVPWAEISGDMLTMCLPSAYVRGMRVDQLIHITQGTWDKVVKSDINFRGDHWASHMRQRVVFDVQLRLGNGHSGYPIVANIDWLYNLLNLNNDTSNSILDTRMGFWGMCHEIGHNFQREAWTPKLFVETTNNVYALMNFVVIFRVPLPQIMFGGQLFESRSVHEAANYLIYPGQKPTSFIMLHYFSQLIHYFGFGLISQAWNSYDSADAGNGMETSFFDNWIRKLSIISGYNMAPFHDLWRFNFTDSTRDAYSHLPCFMPLNDTLTKLIRNRKPLIAKDFQLSCTSRVEEIPILVKLRDGFDLLQESDIYVT